MNLFQSILDKAQNAYTGSSLYKWMENLWSSAYDWANPNQDPIQRFLDDPKIEPSKKQALFSDLQAGKPKDAISNYISQKYYQEAQFKEAIPMAQQTFPTTGKEWVIEGSLRAIWNIPSSLYNLGAWTVNIGATALQEWVWPTASMLGKWIVKGIWQGAEWISQAYQEGGALWATSKAIEGTQKLITQDPAMIFAPQMAKGAGTLTKMWGKAIVTGVEKVAPKITNAIIKTPKALWKWVTTWTEYSTSLATGLSREAQQTIKSSPNLYKEARLWNITAQGELENFVKATETRLDDLSELWKGYESIKKWNKVASVDDITNAYVKATEWVRSTTLTKADKLVLKDANDYMSQMKGQLDETDILGLRRQLDSITYDPNTGLKRKLSPTGERMVNSMRAEVDKIAKERIAWLKELDAQYAPEVWLLKDIKKQIYDANGNIKPTALSTIWNIVGKNKDFKLEQFQKIYPELGARIKALKAFEEVQALGEIKTWSVVRQGGAIAMWSAIAPWVGTVIGWLATNPYVVARILEAYWLAKAKIQSILSKWSKITPQEAALVAKAVQSTSKEKMADIINNLHYDAKTNKLTSWTIWPKKLSTMGKIETAKTPKSIVAQESPSPKPIVKNLQKTEKSVGDMETKKLIEEARKYKSAEEFVKNNSLKSNRITSSDDAYQKWWYDWVLNIVEDADNINLTLIELKEKWTWKWTEIVKELKQYADANNKKLKIINSSNDKYWNAFKFFEKWADWRYVYKPNSKPFTVEWRRWLDYETPKKMIGKEVSYNGKNYEITWSIYSDESWTLYYKIKWSDWNKIVTPDKLSEKIEWIAQKDKEITPEIIKPKRILWKKISKEDEQHLFKKKNTRK